MALCQLPSQIITLQIPLLYVINIFTLASGPNHHVLCVSITLPLVILLITQSLYREWHASWGNHYAINCTVWSVVFIYVDWILLGSPDREGWHKIRYDKIGNVDKDEKKDEVPKKGYKDQPGGAGRTFASRTWWALRLATTNRYTGWSNQVKNVYMEVPAIYPRLNLIACKTLGTLIFFVLKDIMVSYSAASPYGSWVDIRTLKPFQPFLSSSPFLIRFWYTWIHIMLTFTTLEVVNSAYGVVSVATYLANPRNCPSMFGKLSDLYSVRSAWSRVWHQQCRPICSTPGTWLTRDVLILRKGSFASKYLQLFVAFGISGWIHGAASMLVNREFDDDGALMAFLGQAVIIMLEDHAIDLGKRMGFRDGVFWRILGFLWMRGAVGWGVEGWFVKMIARGIWVQDREWDFFGIGPTIVT